MKRIISAVMIITLALCFASCAKKGPNPDNWHNNSGINKLMSAKIEGEDINLACVFGENGVDFYYNDRIEKELFCTVTYDEPDANPEYTALGASCSDADGDSSSDLLVTFTRADGSTESVIYYWTPGADTFKTDN